MVPKSSKSSSHASTEEKVVFPKRWTVFAPFDATEALVDPESLRRVPDTLRVGGRVLVAEQVTAERCQVDFRRFLGEPPLCHRQAAYVFVPLRCRKETEATLGFGGDHRLQAWLDGEPILPLDGVEDSEFPPAVTNIQVPVRLRRGPHLLVVRFVSGKAGPVLALGGPAELQTGDFRSILADPFRLDSRWTARVLRASIGTKPAINIGTRRELFVDDFLIDRLTGAAVRRLHHPVPREVVLKLDRPWEGSYSGTFLPLSLVEEAGRVRMYYKVANYEGPEHPSEISDRAVKSRPEVTCLAESEDGIRFARPHVGLYAHRGSLNNNIVWWGQSYLTPFKDANPAAAPDCRYKAISRHERGGLGVYASADGIRWRSLSPDPVITRGAFDSQNLAFWDPLRELYVEYHRGQSPGVYERSVMTCTSRDFLNWSDPQPLAFEDARREHLYTNCIRPYARAPHLYLGTPARFVPSRTKIANHSDNGISDAILMSSRDGLRFQRWEEGWIRPGADPEVWTDRNNYPSWGMLQLSPAELSLYWCEHNGHPDVYLRRGTLRTDGFVSVHAGGAVGELLTRPFSFSGNTLEVNYATSAVGSLLFELCDEQGRAFPGYSLKDSEVLFGNELAHGVTWRGRVTEVGAWAERPVRLRVRLQDADLYSFRFFGERAANVRDASGG